MATSSTAVTGNPAFGVAGTPSEVTRTDKAGQMGSSDMFLKLLMAQMSHQDPTNPTDSSQMMSQLAQFSQVEGITNTNKQLTALNVSQDVSAALAMIGKTVTYVDANGNPHSGTVDSAKPTSNGSILTVGGVDIYTGQVAQVA